VPQRAEAVEAGRRDGRLGRLAAHVGGAGQRGPPVERGVLDALGHHRGAGLLEPDLELVARRVARADPAEREVADQAQRLVPLGGQDRGRRLRRGLHPQHGLGGAGSPGTVYAR
jgi:hypothetical protein